MGLDLKSVWGSNDFLFGCSESDENILELFYFILFLKFLKHIVI